jgi:DNA-binding LytR/AlgR family response regulator
MNTENLIHVGGRMKCSPASIMWLESDINYTRLYFSDGSVFLTSTNLGKLEIRFASCNFFRANRSSIINLDFIANYEKKTASIRMENNEIIHLSRKRVKQFINLSNQLNKDLSW